MFARTVLRYLRGGQVIGRSLVMADLYQVMRAQFLHAALDMGLLHALIRPKTRDELIDELRIENADLLDGMLEHGLAWREFGRSNGRFALRGRRSRALVSAIGDPHAALLQETISYHGSVYTELARRSRGDELGDYLSATGELVARSSRVGEPASAAFVLNVVRRFRPRTVLDVGCGSAIHLRHAVSRRHVSGVGIELSPEAAEHARINVRTWGLEDRIRIVRGNVLDPQADLGGPFDLAMLFHNLYYFARDERPVLFDRLRTLLAPNGVLAIFCTFLGGGRLATDMDVVLRSTKGNTALPDLDETMTMLARSGFEVERPKRFIPFEPLYGLTARPTTR
jgi:predicted O-methyltransferase YrrM